jgi:hypothetical protein
MSHTKITVSLHWQWAIWEENLDNLIYNSIKKNKLCCIVPAQTQWTRVQRLSPENKEVSPYIPLQAGYRSKRQSSTHRWLHVTSLATSFSQSYVTFMFQFFKFYHSALPSPPPGSLSEHQPVCFSSGPPPCYIIPPFDAWTHLGSKSIILI